MIQGISVTNARELLYTEVHFDRDPSTGALSFYWNRFSAIVVAKRSQKNAVQNRQTAKATAKKERHAGEILHEQELGRSFWGFPGKYVKRNMLLSFIEEVGHRHDNLLEGSLESGGSESEPKEGDDNNDDDDLLLLATAREIDLSKGTTRIRGEEEDSDEELEEMTMTSRRLVSDLLFGDCCVP